MDEYAHTLERALLKVSQRIDQLRAKGEMDALEDAQLLRLSIRRELATCRSSRPAKATETRAA